MLRLAKPSLRKFVIGTTAATTTAIIADYNRLINLEDILSFNLYLSGQVRAIRTGLTVGKIIQRVGYIFKHIFQLLSLLAHILKNMLHLQEKLSSMSALCLCKAHQCHSFAHQF